MVFKRAGSRGIGPIDAISNAHRESSKNRHRVQIRHRMREKLVRIREGVESRATFSSVAEPSYLSLSSICRNHGLKAKPLVFQQFMSKGLMSYENNKYSLTRAGEDIGGKYYKNENGETWIVWDEDRVRPLVIESKRKLIKELNLPSLSHLTHITNLSSILEHGLQCHKNNYKKFDISNKEVNARRDKPENIHGRKVHDYVPMYFNPKNSMLYQVQQQYGDNILILSFRNELMADFPSIFSDQNAANSNARFTDKIYELEKFDWEAIYSEKWTHDGVVNKVIKSRMMSECLVYGVVNVSYLEAIYCATPAAMSKVESICRNQGVIANVFADRNRFF